MGWADTPQVVDCTLQLRGEGGFEPKEHDQDSSVGCPDKSQVVEWLTVYSAVARGGG